MCIYNKYIYTYMQHIYIYVPMYINIYIWIHINRYTHIYTYIYIYIYIYMLALTPSDNWVENCGPKSAEDQGSILQTKSACFVRRRCKGGHNFDIKCRWLTE